MPEPVSKNSGKAAQSEGNGAIMEPFVLAFALIGLVMAVLIVGNVSFPTRLTRSPNRVH